MRAYSLEMLFLEIPDMSICFFVHYIYRFDEMMFIVWYKSYHYIHIIFILILYDYIGIHAKVLGPFY